MTFSIVARSADGHFHGVAVASKFLAVGSAVPWAQAEVGAVATQAWANLAFGAQGLAMLRTGVPAAETVDALVASDPGREQRQVGVIAAAGPGASHTGAKCPDWAGGRTGPDFAVQGNILTGPEVVDAVAETWRAGADLEFPERLVTALAAGDAAGGDRRGRQSAALYVVGKGAGYGPGSDVAVDLRSDDHADPVGELDRLLKLHRLYFGAPDPEAALPLEGALAEEVAFLLRRRGRDEADLSEALSAWAGEANLEERLLPGRIDAVVLDWLRAAGPR